MTIGGGVTIGGDSTFGVSLGGGGGFLGGGGGGVLMSITFNFSAVFLMTLKARPVMNA